MDTYTNNIMQPSRLEAAELAALQGAVWLTTNQLARLLQISPSTLEKARSTGKGLFARLAYRKMGRSVRYSRDEVLEFLNSTKIAGSRPQRAGS